MLEIDQIARELRLYPPFAIARGAGVMQRNRNMLQAQRL